VIAAPTYLLFPVAAITLFFIPGPATAAGSSRRSTN
jgi:hypothetical protein